MSYWYVPGDVGPYDNKPAQRFKVYLPSQFGPDCRGIFDTEDEAKEYIRALYQNMPLVRGRAWYETEPVQHC